MGVGEGGNVHGVSWTGLEKAEGVVEGLRQTHTSGLGALLSPYKFLPHFLLQLVSLVALPHFCHSYFPLSICSVAQAHLSAHRGFSMNTSSGDTTEEVLSPFFQ